MWCFRSFIRHLGTIIYTLMVVLCDTGRFLVLCLRPAPALAAENLFLRKQLAQYQERQVKPRRVDDATRIALVWLSRFFNWKSALVIVQPATLIRWHRQGFRWFWRWRSKPGRPALPKDLQALIRRMALENPTWGQERIANELLLKLGLKVSPRTVRKYMPDHCIGGPGKRGQSQRWSTFIRNHAKGIIACDFCVAVTATFRVLYVFVMIEHASRRLLHVNVTAHPTAQWVIQQCRASIPADHTYRILIHDRDAIFSKAVDQNVKSYGAARHHNASANPGSERDLRTGYRDATARMPGLYHPPERNASLWHLERMGNPLQRRPTPYVTGTGHSQADTAVTRVTAGPSPLASQ